MITRIELDGFKTFQDFGIDIAPFQVIIGGNGAGKSNLFDALRLLSGLADGDINQAFQELSTRGSPDELFTLLPGGESEKCMSLAVELFVEPRVEDNLGRKVELEHRRFRYELRLCRRRSSLLGALYIEHEFLGPIRRADDRWLNRYGISNEVPAAEDATGPGEAYINTTLESIRWFSTEASDEALEEGQAPERLVRIRSRDGKHKSTAIANMMRQTMLSTVTGSDYPEAFAVRNEMWSWQFLLLWNLEAIRSPASMLEVPTIGPDGSRLAAVLGRMYDEDPHLLTDISRDMANLVPGIKKVVVEEDSFAAEFRVRVESSDGRSFSARLLSDGTLRLLALATLKNDPDYTGVLCIEEPENGVPPYRLRDVGHLLRQLATDLSDHEQSEEPLRQVLINTHSPLLVNEVLQHKNGAGSNYPELIFAHTVTRVSGPDQSAPMRITHMVTVTDDPGLQHELEIDDAEGAYILRQVRAFLSLRGLSTRTHEPGEDGRS